MSRSPQTAQAGRKPERYVAGWQATMRLLQRGLSWSGSERNCVFLNYGNRFADVSAASGLDFSDDARGLAVVDWDQDGDIDLWLSNRTGPRLRLMLNRAETENDFVAFRLRGTVSNRDGVGARVSVELGDQTRTTLMRTLYAGDGFLSQSSKWLHFGLGSQPEIDQVEVRWPGGAVENFSGVEPNGRYLLVEGRGEAVFATAARRAVGLEPSPQVPPKRDSTDRVLLPMRFPLPRLRHALLDGPAEKLVDVGSSRNSVDAPLLINFWASWCLPCRAELKELTARQEELRSGGLAILALSVDGLGQDKTTQPVDAQRLLDKIEFPFSSGLATPELLDKIELLQEILFDRSLPFAVPLSLLLDGEGFLAAIYRGRANTDVLLRDLALLDASAQSLHAASAPLPGRWLARLPDPDLQWVAKQFKERYPEDMEHLLELALDQQREDRPAALSNAQQDQQDREEATIYLGLAEAAFEKGQAESAIEHLRKAIELDDGLARAHKSLAGLLQLDGKPQEAIRHYQRAVDIAPEDAEAHHGLGVILRATGGKKEALRHLREAVRLRPDWPVPRIPLTWTLITQPPIDLPSITEAVRHAERAVELSEDRHPVALDTLAAAYAAAGLSSEAIGTASEAVERARARGEDSLASEIENRLEGYKRQEGTDDGE